MNTSLTISVKGLLVTAAALTALVAAYLVGASGSPPPAHGTQPAAASSVANEDATPTLRMTGRGTAVAVPDELSFTLTATAKRDDLQDALTASSAAMTKAIKTLGTHGVNDRDVATTRLQMQPEYDYPRNGSPVLTGYRVTQQARATVKDLSEGGKAISTVVASGDTVVKVDDIRLEVGDVDEVLAKARTAAVEEATAKASQYAEAAGVELGDVMSIREEGSNQPNPMELGVAAMDRDDAAVPIAPGEQESGVTVEIVWSLVG